MECSEFRVEIASGSLHTLSQDQSNQKAYPAVSPNEYQQGVDPALRILAVMCLLFSAGGFAIQASNAQQVDADLVAKRRLFSPIGPGLKQVRSGADGKIYVLASPSPGLVVYSPEARRLLTMHEVSGLTEAALAEAKASGDVLVEFGEDFDVDADGNIYIADRAANKVQVYSRDGRHVREIAVNAPLSVAAMPEGEVAVATLQRETLVTVFDKSGRLVREFGDPETFTERKDLNRFLNLGELATDAMGHLYYGFRYFPEPTIRQFDRFGYAGQDVHFTELDAMPEAAAVRREIARQEKRGDTPRFKQVMTAMGVDQQTGEVWIAIGNMLLHFDKEGNRRALFRLYTPQNARLEAVAIVVEKDRLLVGGDPQGIYEFDRTDQK
jgi:hypothetical protein